MRRAASTTKSTGHHVERRHRVAGERKRHRQRRRHQEDGEGVRPLEAVDLAGPRVAHHDAGTVDGGGERRPGRGAPAAPPGTWSPRRRCGSAGPSPARPRGSRPPGRPRRTRWRSGSGGAGPRQRCASSRTLRVPSTLTRRISARGARGRSRAARCQTSVTVAGERLALRAGEAEVHLLDVALEHLGPRAPSSAELGARRGRVLRLDQEHEPVAAAARRPARPRTSRFPMKPGIPGDEVDARARTHAAVNSARAGRWEASARAPGGGPPAGGPPWARAPRPGPGCRPRSRPVRPSRRSGAARRGAPPPRPGRARRAHQPRELHRPGRPDHHDAVDHSVQPDLVQQRHVVEGEGVPARSQACGLPRHGVPYGRVGDGLEPPALGRVARTTRAPTQLRSSAPSGTRTRARTPRRSAPGRGSRAPPPPATARRRRRPGRRAREAGPRTCSCRWRSRR